MIPKGDLAIPLKHPHHVHRRCWWYILVHKIIILPSLSPPLKNPPHHKSRSYQQRQKHKYKRLKTLIPKTRSPLTITKATLRRRRRRRRRSSLKTATSPFNSVTIIKTKRKTRNNNVKRRDDCARKTKIKKALSRCHEILRQQRAPGDGWSDARKEKENATRAPTHIPMHDNVDVWASSGTVMWTSPLFTRLAVFLAECRKNDTTGRTSVLINWLTWVLHGKFEMVFPGSKKAWACELHLVDTLSDTATSWMFWVLFRIVGLFFSPPFFAPFLGWWVWLVGPLVIFNLFFACP